MRIVIHPPLPAEEAVTTRKARNQAEAEDASPMRTVPTQLLPAEENGMTAMKTKTVRAVGVGEADGLAIPKDIPKQLSVVGITRTIAQAVGSAIPRAIPKQRNAAGTILTIVQAVGLAIPKDIPKQRNAAGTILTIAQAAGSAILKGTRGRRNVAGIILTIAQAVGSAIPRAIPRQHDAAGEKMKSVHLPAHAAAAIVIAEVAMIVKANVALPARAAAEADRKAVVRI
jgi:hypothetical protein